MTWGEFRSKPTNENAGQCLRSHLLLLLIECRSPPSAPLEPIPEPFRSKMVAFRSHQVHPTRDAHNSDAGSATYTSLLVQEFSGSWRTPQGTIRRAPPRLHQLKEPEPGRASPPSRPFYA